MNQNIPIYSPGDLVKCVETKDQSLYVKKTFVGRLGLVLARLVRDQGGTTTTNMYDVLIGDKIIKLHSLDLQLVSKVRE